MFKSLPLFTFLATVLVLAKSAPDSRIYLLPNGEPIECRSIDLQSTSEVLRCRSAIETDDVQWSSEEVDGELLRMAWGTSCDRDHRGRCIRKH